MSEGAPASLRELRTPRAAGITGVLFAGLFAAAVTLERIAAPASPTIQILRDGTYEIQNAVSKLAAG